MIDLTNFVKINIDYPLTIPVKGTRDTVALLCESSAISTSAVYESLSDLKLAVTNETVRTYAEEFFAAGGKKLHLYQYSEGMTFPEDEIVIASCMSTSVEDIVGNYNTDATDGIYKKIFVGVTSATESDYSGFGLCLKNVKAADVSKGYEMWTAAYLSKINAYGIDQVKDYCYTVEDIPAATDDNSTFETILDNDLNVNIELAGNLLNVGGNCTDGHAVVNEYMLILLQQTCTDRLISLLRQKIKGMKGTASIKAVLESELNYYVTDGYLDTDKVWKKDDLTIEYNGKTYTVIRKGTALDKGYRLFVVPYADLSDIDIAAHKAPPIYLVIADSYDIRTVEITGEVL